MSPETFPDDCKSEMSSCCLHPGRYQGQERLTPPLVWWTVCHDLFQFCLDQKPSASLTKEGLNGTQYSAITPAPLGVVPQMHSEGCSSTHHWGTKVGGEWQHRSPLSPPPAPLFSSLPHLSCPSCHLLSNFHDVFQGTASLVSYSRVQMSY